MLALLACGGRAQDSTTLLPEPGPEPEPVEPEPAPSRALTALAEPATRDAFCGWVGSTAASLPVGAGSQLDCGEVVSRCREAAADSSLMAAPEVQADLLGMSGNLESVLGCPATLGELDGCVAELIEVVVARYPEGPACGAAGPVEPLGLQDVSSLSSCVQVGLKCPELLQQLLAAAR